MVHPLYIAILAMDLEHYNAESTSNSAVSNKYVAFFTIGTFLCYSSFFGLLALTVDRFLAIHLHLRYQEFVTRKRVVAVVISIMVFSSFLSSLPWCIPEHDTLKIYSSVEIVCFVFITI